MLETTRNILPAAKLNMSCVWYGVTESHAQMLCSALHKVAVNSANQVAGCIGMSNKPGLAGCRFNHNDV